MEGYLLENDREDVNWLPFPKITAATNVGNVVDNEYIQQSHEWVKSERKEKRIQHTLIS